MPTSHNIVHNSGIEDSLGLRVAQLHLALVPRIIATHWLRADDGAAS